jgi:hypothetical protein
MIALAENEVVLLPENFMNSQGIQLNDFVIPSGEGDCISFLNAEYF